MENQTSAENKANEAIKKPVKKRVLSDEQRQALREKMKKVQENRWKNHTKAPPKNKLEDKPILSQEVIDKVENSEHLPLEKTQNSKPEKVEKFKQEIPMKNEKGKKKPYCKLVFYDKPDENFKFKWGKKKEKPVYSIDEIEEDDEETYQETPPASPVRKQHDFISKMASEYF